MGMLKLKSSIVPFIAPNMPPSNNAAALSPAIIAAAKNAIAKGDSAGTGCARHNMNIITPNKAGFNRRTAIVRTMPGSTMRSSVLNARNIRSLLPSTCNYICAEKGLNAPISVFLILFKKLV